MVEAFRLSQRETSVDITSLRGRSSFSRVSLAGAIYLIVALSIPGAFLIAKQASLLSSSSSHFSLTSEQQWGGSSSEEDGGEDSSWTGPKRLRGALLSKVGIDKKTFVGSLLAAPHHVVVAATPMLEAAAEREAVVAEREAPPLKDGALPQELLGRGPPSSLS